MGISLSSFRFLNCWFKTSLSVRSIAKYLKCKTVRTFPSPAKSTGSKRKAGFTFHTSAYNLEDIWNSSTSTLWERDFSPEGAEQIHILTLFVGTEGAWAWNYQFPPVTFVWDKARGTLETHKADPYRAFTALSLEFLTGIHIFSSCGCSQSPQVTSYFLWVEMKGKWFLHLT